MRLEDLSEVVVDRSGGHKFIVIQIDDEAGNRKIIIRANQYAEYHSDIFKPVLRGLPSAWRVVCIGGGRIHVSPEKKKIEIWDSSGSYGLEPDRIATLALLKSTFPEYEVSVR